MTPVEQLEMIGRIALAAGLGAAVGLEREVSDKAAGLRTLALVASGAAAFTVAGFAASSSSGEANAFSDASRIAAQIVTGVGFLGAGLIIFRRRRIRGLTTAADVWVCAAIGMLCGFGLLLVAAGTTVLVVVVVVGLRPIARALQGREGPPRPPLDAEDESDDEDDKDHKDARPLL